MANLAGLGIDPNVKETGEFTCVPPGKYTVVIVDDDLKTTKAGTGKILELTLQIMDRGEWYGTELIDRINIINPNPKAQQIGQGTLKRLCTLTGCPFPPDDTRKMYGKNIRASVKVEEFESNTEEGRILKSNKISGYSKAENAAKPAATAYEPVEKSAEPPKNKPW